MNRESLMSEPLQDWLRQRGYIPYVEVNIFYNPTDMVGVKGKDIICIEMKTSLTKKVIRSAAILQIVTNYSYCAVATKPKKSGVEQCKGIGLGILSVKGDDVTEILTPQISKNNSLREYYTERVLKIVSQMDSGGVAGNPCMKGIGPAQDCYDRVQEYLTANPDATWDEIYKEVSNHYANPRSMYGAMRVVAEKRNKCK